MRLSNEWFTALLEDEDGHLVTVSGRDELTEFIQSGIFEFFQIKICSRLVEQSRRLESSRFL